MTLPTVCTEAVTLLNVIKLITSGTRRFACRPHRFVTFTVQQRLPSHTRLLLISWFALPFTLTRYCLHDAPRTTHGPLPSVPCNSYRSPHSVFNNGRPSITNRTNNYLCSLGIIDTKCIVYKPCISLTKEGFPCILTRSRFAVPTGYVATILEHHLVTVCLCVVARANVWIKPHTVLFRIQRRV